ncbi:MAG: HAD-IA family hydrolase [Gemmatales bacterium]
MPPLLLLDLDGTLVDTLGFIIDCFRRSVAPVVKRLPTDEEIVATFGPAEIECIARLLSHFDQQSLLHKPLQSQHITDSAKRFHQLYDDGHATGRVELYPGMREVINEAKTSGWALGVFTGKGRSSALATVAHLRLTHVFDVIVTSDDVPRPKPAPDGVQKAALHVGTICSKTYFVGDNPADILSGNAAGAISVAALWGAFNREETRNAKPAYILNSPDELHSLLRQWYPERNGN